MNVIPASRSDNAEGVAGGNPDKRQRDGSCGASRQGNIKA